MFCLALKVESESSSSLHLVIPFTAPHSAMHIRPFDSAAQTWWEEECTATEGKENENERHSWETQTKATAGKEYKPPFHVNTGHLMGVAAWAIGIML